VLGKQFHPGWAVRLFNFIDHLLVPKTQLTILQTLFTTALKCTGGNPQFSGEAIEAG